MRKYFHGSVLFLCILALCVSGCGGGSAADPMGTATVQFIDETGKVLFPEEGGGLFAFSIMPGESRQLIVWVTNARDGGKTIVPVINEKVTFTLLTPGNGGSVTMVKDRTDANGRAVGLYTAGNNFQFDEVRATTEAGAAAQLTIIKVGAIAGARIASMATSPTPPTVTANQTVVITATVNVNDVTGGHPVQGEPVTFTLPTNGSGACFINAVNACVVSVIASSDASGNAVAVYRAGGGSPNVDVYDTVRATLANGSTSSVVITRSAVMYSLTVTADPTTLNVGGGSSAIKANVVNLNATGTNKGVSGVTVTFTNAGGALSATSATTDGNGNAGGIVFTAGAGVVAGTTAGVVTASITVSGNTYTAAVVINYK
ncbi:MAG: hypothetical protein C0390_10725 [Syntrophus sp. (in: bacteria)]|nr:hypothetical protein [Syntrophus sp. (in: bacteria)]